MATVVSITNPITGAVEQVDKLDHTAQQIDDAVALATQISNPNLLDNPNFAVNQRGATSVPGSPAAYIVDRWKTYGYAAATVSVLENGHISMNGGNASGGSSLRQIFEKTLPAGTYTLSVKVSSCSNPNSSGNYGILYARKGTDAVGTAMYIKGPGITSKTFTVADGEVDGISIGCVNTSTIEFECVKMELGSQQTLAHKDANGNWVLNEIPDYGEQLRRCQRYFMCYKAGTVLPCVAYSEQGGWFLGAALPITGIRTSPVNNIGDGLACSVRNINAESDFISKTISNWGYNSGVQLLRISGGENTSATWPYIIRMDADLTFSADL